MTMERVGIDEDSIYNKPAGENLTLIQNKNLS